MKKLVSQKESDGNRDAELRTYLALKEVQRRAFFGLGKKITEIKVVGKTRATNWLWARANIGNVDYDNLVIADPLH